MNLQLISTVLLASSWISGLNSEESCPKGWDTFGKSCYFSSSYRQNWESARKTCKRLDPRADLASIHSEEEHVFFARSMRSYIWTGLNSISSIGSWVWSDQSSVDFTRWKGGEPNTPYTKRCSSIYLEYSGIEGSQGYMLSEDCSNQKHYVCQLRSVACPPRWEHYNGWCYILPNELRTWNEARRECVKIHEGSDLASIHSDDQFRFFVDRMYVRQWIGLHSKTPYQWGWSDGSALDYNKISSDGSVSKQCAELWIYKLVGLEWKATDCQDLQPFLCKYQLSGESRSPLKPTQHVTSRPEVTYEKLPTTSQDVTYCPAIPQESLPQGVTVQCNVKGNRTTCQHPVEYGSTASYRCSDFYEGTGKIAVCGRNGDWSDDGTFTCKPTCGLRNNSRTISLILRGNTPRRGEWPWHVGIYIRHRGKWEYHCGGTLVSDKVVVTVAHCVTVRNRGATLHNPSDVRLAFGKLFSPYEEDDPNVQYGVPELISISPHYNWVILDPDIAVIVMAEPVTITSYVRPACVPGALGDTIDFTTIDGAKGTVLGWGLDENHRVSVALQMIEMPVASQERCIKHFQDSNAVFRIRETVYCAGRLRGETVCPGDSGGGMVFPVSVGGQLRYVLQGIVSSGVSTECNPTDYIFFTRATRFSEMIAEHIP